MSNSRQVFRSPEAQEDLLSIWQFGADKWSPDQADEHLRDIEVMCDRLRVHPELGRKRDELIVGLYSIPISPHVIFYRQSPKAITIVRVLPDSVDVPQHFRH
jgi:toxin ParE1/3/4